MIKFTTLKTVLLLCSCSLAISSCNEDEWKSSIHELKVKLGSESAMVNEPFEFTDLSLGLTSRVWTFEDGIPSSSSNPVVKVSFTKPGTKKYTLTLQYDNGTTESKEFSIEVKSVLKAEINIPSITPMSCVKLNEPVQFIAEVQSDEEVKYEWIFPGGSPESSTEASPTVTWHQKRYADVELKVIRMSDNAQLNMKKAIHVGNYPMLRTMTEYDTDSWAAEAGSKLGAWIVWDGSADIFGQNVVVRCNGGANGTDHALQIKYNGKSDWQFFPRDMWVSNAKLHKGQKYEFCFYAKSAKPAKINELILINAAYDYMYDGVAQAAIATDWSKFYPDIPLTFQTAETRFVSGSSLDIASDWQLFRYEFTVGDKDINGTPVPDTLLNTYPFFVFTTNNGAVDIYMDEIEINLLED